MAAAAAAADDCRANQVQLRGDWGTARFTVDVADTAETRAQGLMHVETMPRSKGMLFVYPFPREVGFWMKNTLIPLDMLFVDETGTVIKVHENAIPHDLRPVMSDGATLVVLEVNGGLAGQMGITPGSEMRHPAFDPDKAAWPCN
ncbi:DUF192 domain-containing protein [Roseovarius faecimaris]|nr:DUF192 domain-containing protein [Roseovarius faecimaris]